MSEFLAQTFEYWTAGGPLLLPIAAVCFAMWAYYLRARQQLVAAARLPPGLDATLEGLSANDGPSALPAAQARPKAKAPQSGPTQRHSRAMGTARARKPPANTSRPRSA